MTLGTYVLVFVVMAVASAVQSSVGMGQGLLAAPLLRLLHPELLPGPIVLAGLLTGMVLAFRNSHRADLVEVMPAIGGRIIGIAIALLMLASLSERGLSLAVGILVLSLVGLRVGRVRIERTPRTLTGTGVVSGVGGTIAALGGAPMGLLYEQHVKARDFRGPMGIFQASGSLITVASLVAVGEFDRRAWLLGLALLPPIGVGWTSARWLTPIVDRGVLGPAVLVMSASSAMALIITELI